MAYEEVHSPIITDETGQAILTKLNEIKQVLSTPADAEDVNYDNTTSGMTADNVQEAVDELKSNLTDYIKAVSFTVPSSITRGADLTTYVNNNLDSGYKFLCWQVKCSTSGFVQDVYMTDPMIKKGTPYWSGTIGSGSIICVFFEIRDI